MPRGAPNKCELLHTAQFLSRAGLADRSNGHDQYRRVFGDDNVARAQRERLSSPARLNTCQGRSISTFESDRQSGDVRSVARLSGKGAADHEWPCPRETSVMTSMPEVKTEWHRFEQLSADQLYELLRFRQHIFVVEQASPYPDLDGLDQGAWHLLLRSEGELVGYARLITSSLRIGRVAVALSLRGHGLGRRLIDEALRFCRERYPVQDVVLAAQLNLVPFYERFGFAVTSEPYDDFGIGHVEMSLRGTS